MSGLLALLDDVAAIAKVAAASVDDIAGQAIKTTGKVAGTVIDDAAKAGAKAAGVIIDDAAVTPKYTLGFSADRELPIVWRIARGSIRNKLLVLLPAALALSAFASWAIAPLLILGGLYLCFEGAEKVLHWIGAQEPHVTPEDKAPQDAAHLEETRVAGAVKTDFILSAEIMTLALAEISSPSPVLQAITLAIVAIFITALVYGAVALIVKADDLGLRMAERGRLSLTRSLGRGLVKGMPTFMTLLTIVGTLAMLWVGGSIVIHSLEVIGWELPAHLVHDVAAGLAHSFGDSSAVEWGVTALIDGIVGVILGILLVPVAAHVISPLIGLFGGKKASAGH